MVAFTQGFIALLLLLTIADAATITTTSTKTGSVVSTTKLSTTSTKSSSTSTSTKTSTKTSTTTSSPTTKKSSSSSSSTKKSTTSSSTSTKKISSTSTKASSSSKVSSGSGSSTKASSSTSAKASSSSSKATSISSTSSKVTSSTSSTSSKPTSSSVFSSNISTTSTSATSTSSAAPSTYTLTDNYVGSNFLSSFTFETFYDPTNGRVNYVNQSYAQSRGLVSSTGNTFTMKSDSTTVLNPNGTGRDSIRIKSNKQYTTHLAVFDLAHMPQGCATWPAVWETDDTNWPNSGEADILEGVNDVSPNRQTLHTSANCSMPSSVNQTGTSYSTDCYWNVNGNEGCTVASNKPNSYGPSFNAAGGGWYVIERTSSSIAIYFWSRSESGVPASITSGSSTISSASFGAPIAYFPSSSTCDIASHFGGNNIIFDLTFCGDWAGATFSQDGCGSSCVDYVNNNPSAFQNAYWVVNAVRVYT